MNPYLCVKKVETKQTRGRVSGYLLPPSTPGIPNSSRSHFCNFSHHWKVSWGELQIPRGFLDTATFSQTVQGKDARGKVVCAAQVNFYGFAALIIFSCHRQRHRVQQPLHQVAKRPLGKWAHHPSSVYLEFSQGKKVCIVLLSYSVSPLIQWVSRLWFSGIVFAQLLWPKTCTELHWWMPIGKGSVYLPPQHQYHTPNQFNNKSGWSGNISKKPMDSLKREVWDGGVKVNLLTPSNCHRKLGAMQEIPLRNKQSCSTISADNHPYQREFSSPPSNNSVKFCQSINHIIPMAVLKREPT